MTTKPDPFHRGLKFAKKGRPDLALRSLLAATRQRPGSAEAWYNLGVLQKELGSISDAKDSYLRAVRLHPSHYLATNNLGLVYADLHDPKSAIKYLKLAVRLRPSASPSLNNLANIYHQLGQLRQAVTYYRRAITADAHNAVGLTNLGLTYVSMGKSDQAISCFIRAIKANSADEEPYGHLLYQLMIVCDWAKAAFMAAALDKLTARSLAAGRKPSEIPFLNVIRKADPAQNLGLASAWAKSLAIAANHPPPPSHITPHQPIRIGYLGSDFRDHPVGHLIAGLFSLHNRRLFTTSAYSYGPDDRSPTRQKIASGVDKFIDIQSYSHTAAAEQIRADEIDILIDLNGHTRLNRLEILAQRPAPIQITWLGYPGTTGTAFIDYLIADRTVLPPNHQGFYTEKILYLPHAYQITDHTRPISTKVVTRSDCRLPTDALVLASFNASYKIEQVVFDTWLDILHAIPTTVLWLLVSHPLTKSNLLAYATSYGISPMRLIFADRIPNPDHLARLPLADLGLDTQTCNGHTTTSDCLWAGLPVITIEGTHFASRVSSSLLQSVGLPQLITHNLAEYKNRILDLCTHPAKLRSIRNSLFVNRKSCFLFDTPRFVKDLEEIYLGLNLGIRI